MGSFREAASNKTCFFLYLLKGKLFIQLFWLLGFTVNFCYDEKSNWWRTLKNKPNKKSSFSLKMCYFVNVSYKESTLQYTEKRICSSICNILLLLPFLIYDQLKWEHQMTVIFGRRVLLSAGNVLKSVP